MRLFRSFLPVVLIALVVISLPAKAGFCMFPERSATQDAPCHSDASNENANDLRACDTCPFCLVILTSFAIPENKNMAHGAPYIHSSESFLYSLIYAFDRPPKVS